MTRAAARTGVGTIAAVAIEQYFPGRQRIIEDDLALPILPFATRAFVHLMRLAPARDWMVRSTERRAPGVWEGLLRRRQYVDEKLTESAPEIDAVVELGAGFDTRAYRLPALTNVPVWELDQPEIIGPKRARVNKLFGEVPAHVRLVPIDFDREKLPAVLASYGYPGTGRTFFTMEGVTQYLTAAGLDSTFAFLAGAATGSHLIFTYVLRDYVEGRAMYGQDRLYRRYVVKDRLWLTGLDPGEVAHFVESYGWQVREHIGSDEMARRYQAPPGRRFAPMPAVERIIYAGKP
jgi:methyltransferase (TIGR00027 family)